MNFLQANSETSFRVKKFENRAELGRKAAEDVSFAIKRLLGEKETISIIFAAAPSQSEFLQALCDDRSIDFTRIRAFHMDEYLGLPEDAPQGFGNFLRDRLFGKVPFHSVYYINGNTANPAKECQRYTSLLKEYPPDIVCMGIGENGHIAFNDPHVAQFHDASLVKTVDLDSVCRNQQVNDGCFSSLEHLPTQALTLTIPALTAAGNHFCMVPAATKAKAVRETVYGPLTEQCPASILRTCKNAVLYIDQNSGAEL